MADDPYEALRSALRDTAKAAATLTLEEAESVSNRLKGVDVCLRLAHADRKHRLDDEAIDIAREALSKVGSRTWLRLPRRILPRTCAAKPQSFSGK